MPVLASTPDFPATPHEAVLCAAPLGEALHLTHVVGAVDLREQHLHRLADHFAGRIAERQLGRVVEHQDASVLVRADH